MLSTLRVLSIPNTSGELVPLPYLLPRVRHTGSLRARTSCSTLALTEVFLDPSCLCLFQWQGARSFSSPSSPSPWALLAAWAGKRSTNVQFVWEHWPYVSRWTKLSVFHFCVTLRDQSVKSSCSLLFPHSCREHGPSGGPGCDHHIYKCGKQRLTSYEPCGIINTDGFSFSYWREP